MVISGITLFISSSQQILKHDKLTIDYDLNEAKIKWRQSSLDLEYTFDGGFEVEIPIKENELPHNLELKYAALLGEYDQILLEKVFKFGKETSYEFYCFKNDKLTKLDF
jgi:uncharacterized protein